MFTECGQNVIATWVETPGTLCASGQHTFENGEDCNYWGTVDMALPAYGGHYEYTFQAGNCNPSSGGGGVITGTTGPYPNGGGGSFPSFDDPCEKIKELIQNQDIKDKIDALYSQSMATGEKAFMVQTDGTPGALIPGNETSVQLGDISGYKGYYHNHPADQPNRKGVKIHSVNDIYKLFEFIVSQPLGTPVSDSFAGMVASMPCGSPSGCPPDGYLYHNFIVTFTGTLSDAQAIKNKNYDFKTLSNDYRDFEHSIRDVSGYASQYGNFMSFKGLEKVFFNALDNMEIPKTQITLQRIDRDGTVYKVTLDASGEPEEIPCPQL
jgi:hypothetical protein